MPINKKEMKEKAVQLHLDNTKGNVWVDNLHMAMRQDDIGIVRLSTNLPEGLFEQVRFMTSKKQLKEFVDIICATLDYEPSNDKLVKRVPPVTEDGDA